MAISGKMIPKVTTSVVAPKGDVSFMNKRQCAGAAMLIAPLVLALWSASAASRRPMPQSKPSAAALGAKVVATVNGEKITRAQVLDDLLLNQTARLGATNPQFANIYGRPAAEVGVIVRIGELAAKRMAASGGKPVSISRADLLDWVFKGNPQMLSAPVQDLIRERAVAQAARKKGIALTETEIKSQLAKSIDSARQRFGPILQGKSDQQILAAFGVPARTLRRGVITSLLVEKMIRKEMEAKMGHKIGQDDFVDASHLVVRVNPKPQDSAATEKAFEEGKTKIAGYLEEIKSGKITFEKAAQQYSDDPTKFRNGKLGVLLRGQTLYGEEFEKALFSLEPGRVSEPIRSPSGWHLLRVDRPGKDIPTAERDQTLENSLRGRVPQYVAQLVSEAKVTNTIPSPPTNPMMMPGNRPPATGSGRPPIPRPMPPAGGQPNQ